MAVLDKKTKKQAKKRLKELEKELGQKLDLKEIEKRLDFRELGKKFEQSDLGHKLDIKELERKFKREPEPESQAGGFLLGLVVGAIIGAVLATLFGKGGNTQVMDQFTQKAESLKDSAADTFHQVRGDAADQGQTFTSQFGDDAAIEREINGDDLVDSATDTIDSASDDVRSAVDEVQDTSGDLFGDAKDRIDRA
jgi:gas vesicle protein